MILSKCRSFCINPQGKNDGLCCDLWSTPLTWAVTLIKQIGPNGKANQMIIPKVEFVTYFFTFKPSF